MSSFIGIFIPGFIGGLSAGIFLTLAAVRRKTDNH